MIGNLKGKPEIQDTLVFKATSSSILVDELNDLENGVALSYQDIIKDDNSANFNGDKTVKRSDSNAMVNQELLHIKQITFMILNLVHIH